MSEKIKNPENNQPPTILGGVYKKTGQETQNYILTEKSPDPKMAIFSQYSPQDGINPNDGGTEFLQKMIYLQKTLTPEEMLQAVSLGYKKEYNINISDSLISFYKDLWGIK